MVLATITAVWHSVFSFALTWVEMGWQGDISFDPFRVQIRLEEDLAF